MCSNSINFEIQAKSTNMWPHFKPFLTYKCGIDVFIRIPCSWIFGKQLGTITALKSSYPLSSTFRLHRLLQSKVYKINCLHVSSLSFKSLRYELRTGIELSGYPGPVRFTAWNNSAAALLDKERTKTEIRCTHKTQVIKFGFLRR